MRTKLQGLVIALALIAVLFIVIGASVHKFGVGSAYVILTGTDIASDNIAVTQAIPDTIIFADEGEAVDWNICGAFAGASLRVKVTTAHQVTLDSTTDDVIHLIDGTALDANDAIDLTAAAGSYVWLVAYDATNWWIMAQVGAVTDGGAD